MVVTSHEYYRYTLLSVTLTFIEDHRVSIKFKWTVSVLQELSVLFASFAFELRGRGEIIATL